MEGKISTEFSHQCFILVFSKLVGIGRIIKIQDSFVVGLSAAFVLYSKAFITERDGYFMTNLIIMSQEYSL